MPCAILGGNRAAALIYVKQGAGLGRLSDSQHNADPLGESYKFRQGPNLHFLHHPMFVLGSFPTVWPDHGDFRGRDASYLPPPAQIRTGPIRAYGSHLGCLTAKRLSGHG